MQAGETSTANIGIEVADSATRISVATHDGPDVRRNFRFPAPPSPDDVLDTVAALTEEVAAGDGRTLDGIGIAVWGRVDSPAGTILDLPLNPEWAGFPLARHLAERLRVPVRLVSAIQAAARAERNQLGAHHTLLFCHASRSILSCLTRDGSSLAGARARDGQLGHLRVVADGPRCSCGQHGHLDAIGSAQSIVRTYLGRASATAEGEAAMHRASRGRPEAITVGQIAALAAEGDPAGRGVLEEAAHGWAEALAVAQVLYDAEVVAIGGTLVAAGELFLARVGCLLAAKLPKVAVPPRLVYATRPHDGALLGACLLATDAVRT